MRIGLSQRVEIVEAYGERRDCLDQNWNKLLSLIGITPVPIPNNLKDPLTWLKAFNIEGFILTGGNDLAFLPDAKNPAPEREHTENLILTHAEKNALPVLGVCRGVQMMNIYFGGEISRVNNHVATRHRLKLVTHVNTFDGFDKVNSFHNWGFKINDISKQVDIAAIAVEDETVEAIVHNTLPWIGVMWHPEREKPFKPEDIHLIKKLFYE